MQSAKPGKNNLNFLSIGEASEYLGISIDTLRRWEKKEKIKAYRSPGGHRYFKKNELDNLFGRKYEREKEVKPRAIKDKITEIRPQIEPVSSTESLKHSDIRVIIEREPRMVNIPVTQPISIISQKPQAQTQSPEYINKQGTITNGYNIQHNNASSPSAPPPSGPEALSAGGIPQQQKSILEAPGLQTQPSRQIADKGNDLTANQIIAIVAGVIAFIIILFTIFVIMSSNNEVLSPIP